MKKSPTIPTTPNPTAKVSPAVALDGLRMFVKAIVENKKTIQQERTKRANIKALQEFEMEKLRTQKEILKDYLEKSFSERRENFDKLFQTLDNAIEKDNIELVQVSLSSIIKISEDSPLKHIEKLKNDFSNPDVKEIEI